MSVGRKEDRDNHHRITSDGYYLSAIKIYFLRSDGKVVRKEKFCELGERYY